MNNQSYMKLPCDLSGSIAKNRFKNELLWGLHKILELYTNEDDFKMVFDYVCDIEVHLTNGRFEFYQIKTANSGESYTQSKLTKVGKKEKSVLTKLYILKHEFDDDNEKVKLALVSNRPFKDGKNKLYNNIEQLKFCMLDDDIKNNIEQELKKEMEIDNVNLNDFCFIYTSMDLLNPKNTLTGELVNFFSENLNVEIKKPAVLYSVLVDRISQKAEYELKANSYDEVIEKKGISKKQIQELFNKHIEISNNSVKKAQETIGKICGDKYGEKIRLLIALSSVVQKINESNNLKKMEKKIIKYINDNIDILEDSLENIIETLNERFKREFDIEYSKEEIKSFIILILMKREEEMYE